MFNSLFSIFVTSQYVRVFAPSSIDTVRVCPNCENTLCDGAAVHGVKSPHQTTKG